MGAFFILADLNYCHQKVAAFGSQRPKSIGCFYNNQDSKHLASITTLSNFKIFYLPKT